MAQRPLKIHKPNFSQANKLPVGRRAARTVTGLTNHYDPTIYSIQNPPPPHTTHATLPTVEHQQYEIMKTMEFEKTGRNQAALGRATRRTLVEPVPELDRDVERLLPGNRSRLPRFIQTNPRFQNTDTFNTRETYDQVFTHTRGLKTDSQATYPPIAPSAATYGPQFRNRLTEDFTRPLESQTQTSTLYHTPDRRAVDFTADSKDTLRRTLLSGERETTRSYSVPSVIRTRKRSTPPTQSPSSPHPPRERSMPTSDQLHPPLPAPPTRFGRTPHPDTFHLVQTPENTPNYAAASDRYSLSFRQPQTQNIGAQETELQRRRTENRLGQRRFHEERVLGQYAHEEAIKEERQQARIRGITRLQNEYAENAAVHDRRPPPQ
ncbi:hypothetical protein BLNAU_743 [Blattamonas nauphoetae]|uniref:Uncharacterized protein n=1 Tax=Blattamonas nauphoetae TaxID=2049346 RepID=A0ABQ9YKE4_9EUKA|nr:hypothetical protein BLNAU_743 [Blattamonas nauphoetae]